MEVRVPRADPAYAMLAHEHDRVRIMEQISRQTRMLADDLLGDIRVPRRRREHAEPRGGEQGGGEGPGLRCAPRAPHDARMGGDAQEFVQDRPGDVPRVGQPPLPLDPGAR